MTQLNRGASDFHILTIQRIRRLLKMKKRNRKECIRPNHHIWIKAYKEESSHIVLLIVMNKMLLGNWQMIRIPGTNIAGSYNISKYEIFCFNHFSLNPTQFFTGFESDFHLCGR